MKTLFRSFDWKWVSASIIPFLICVLLQLDGRPILFTGLLFAVTVLIWIFTYENRSVQKIREQRYRLGDQWRL